ncbi:MAG: hypothetical protein Q9198_000303 [Flavoplaca austrocitrina]
MARGWNVGGGSGGPPGAPAPPSAPNTPGKSKNDHPDNGGSKDDNPDNDESKDDNPDDNNNSDEAENPGNNPEDNPDDKPAENPEDDNPDDEMDEEGHSTTSQEQASTQSSPSPTTSISSSSSSLSSSSSCSASITQSRVQNSRDGVRSKMEKTLSLINHLALPALSNLAPPPLDSDFRHCLLHLLNPQEGPDPLQVNLQAQPSVVRERVQRLQFLGHPSYLCLCPCHQVIHQVLQAQLQPVQRLRLWTFLG